MLAGWLAGSVLGFLALNALIVVLGTASTTRYEQERRVQLQVAVTDGEGRGPSTPEAGIAPGRSSGRVAGRERSGAEASEAPGHDSLLRGGGCSSPRSLVGRLAGVVGAWRHQTSSRRLRESTLAARGLG
jgi:hypothetical protein